MTAFYMRLSREDGKGKESDSIATQRAILYSYAMGAGMTDIIEYVDDGYSGTNIERPSFRKLQNDIENGLIDVVLVKDLSRLARNSSDSNALLDEYFPLHGVRFISVNDGVDTCSGSGGTVFAPLVNMMHEFYSRDISRKIRASLYARMDEGRFVGARPPFGYDAVEGKLFPNSDALTVVEIFKMAASGKSISEIANTFSFGNSRVRRILSNRVYLGHLEQGKTRKLSFRSKVVVSVPQSERHTVLRAHPPIVSDELFHKVERMIKKRSKQGNGFENIFSGIAYCADCGSRMSTVGTRRKGSPCALACSRYKRNGAGACTNHHVDYLVLCKAISNALRNNMPSASFVAEALGIEKREAEELIDFSYIDSTILRLFINRILVSQGSRGKNRKQTITVSFNFASCEKKK